MADVGNAEKKKWIYAFNIVPMKHINRADLISQPPSVTDIPYNESHMKVYYFIYFNNVEVFNLSQFAIRGVKISRVNFSMT